MKLNNPDWADMSDYVVHFTKGSVSPEDLRQWERTRLIAPRLVMHKDVSSMFDRPPIPPKLPHSLICGFADPGMRQRGWVLGRRGARLCALMPERLAGQQIYDLQAFSETGVVRFAKRSERLLIGHEH